MQDRVGWVKDFAYDTLQGVETFKELTHFTFV